MNYWAFVKSTTEVKSEIVAYQGDLIGEINGKDVYAVEDFWVHVEDTPKRKTFWATREEPEF